MTGPLQIIEITAINMKKFAAVDLGAESGRVIVGDVPEIDIVYRFPNRPVRVGESIFWDILDIFTLFPDCTS